MTVHVLAVQWDFAFGEYFAEFLPERNNCDSSMPQEGRFQQGLRNVTAHLPGPGLLGTDAPVFRKRHSSDWVQRGLHRGTD